ncbi:serine/threonine-protein kinase ULK4 [Nematolebias whitei]|uniref:serine/threonine-protein kinase ULK4 n=1 Tax=Nematolebias whitei TaxID=451745 RepID=UPI001897A564|nr:serine/threonine-protein kinase ULK4 [Nematolebias whitei]
MENFILYEKLGAGHSSVVYKGRRKGHLNYVAIICTDKTKKAEITNHVRLSHNMDHPNIVRFHEWYETSKHLWVVAELCTGGSLESVVTLDGSLSEDVVRRFGWDLVKGLKHIHGLGIILSDLTPAKILLDGSGVLKLSSFCLSRAEEESLEDIFMSFSTSEKTDGNEWKDRLKKREQGSVTYSAPEVLRGSETSVSSDLWALGCVLYYMFMGKPPFYSDNHTDLTEMILHQDPPPLRVTTAPPSQDFQSLLKGLLNKNPDTRINWPELLDHPFWTQAKREEEDAGEESNKRSEKRESNGCEGDDSVNLRAEQTDSGHSSSVQSGYLKSKNLVSSNIMSEIAKKPHDRGTESQQVVHHRNSWVLQKEVLDERTGDEEVKTEGDPKPAEVEQMCPLLQPNKSHVTDMLELRPKFWEDQDNTEAIFQLSCHPNLRSSCNISDSLNQNPAVEASSCPDITNCTKQLLHTDSDLSITPIIDNPKILKSPPVRFDPKTLCVPAHSVEKLLSLNDEEWTAFLLQLQSCLEEQNSSSLPISNAPPQSTAVRARLNLLCYLCCVAGNKVISNKLMNSPLLLVLTHQLRQAPNWDVRSKVLRLMGLLALHCSHLEEDSPVTEAVSALTDLLRENLRNNKLKQFVLPPLGELLYLISSQYELPLLRGQHELEADLGSEMRPEAHS